MNNFSNSTCRPVGFFMLPDPDDFPSGTTAEPVRLAVALAVFHQFIFPPFPVGYRNGAVLRACVPKTTVDEYNHSGGPKSNIGFSPEFWKYFPVNPEPQPQCVQLASQCDFTPRVTASLRPHLLADTFGRRHEAKRDHIYNALGETSVAESRISSIISSISSIIPSCAEIREMSFRRPSES